MSIGKARAPLRPWVSALGLAMATAKAQPEESTTRAVPSPPPVQPLRWKPHLPQHYEALCHPAKLPPTGIRAGGHQRQTWNWLCWDRSSGDPKIPAEGFCPPSTKGRELNCCCLSETSCEAVLGGCLHEKDVDGCYCHQFPLGVVWLVS